MFKNYLTVAIRNLFKRDTSSFISIGGLAVAISCCIFILLFISDELQFDRFHVNGDRTYRLVFCNHKTGERAALMAAVVFPSIMSDIPEFESGFRVARSVNVPIRAARKPVTGDLFFADREMLRIMSFPLQRGDAETALNDPFTAVITDSLARKYFGDADPMGKTFSLHGSYVYRVTGILKPIPLHSHIRPEFIVSLSSWNTSEPDMMNDIRYSGVYFYFLLKPNASPIAAENKLKDVFEKYYGHDLEGWGFSLERLDQIYLYSADTQWDIAAHGNVVYVESFAVIALLILFMASFNYANYLTVRVKIREKEIAVRRLLGAGFRSIVSQFLVETVFSTLIALAAAIVIVEVFMNDFNQLTGKELYFKSVLRPEILLSILGVLLVTTVASVLYPAGIALSSDVLYRLKGSAYTSRFVPAHLHIGFRQIVTCLQFVITVSLIAATLVIFRQLDFMRTTNLGFNKEHLLAISNPYGTDMYGRFENFRNLVRGYPHVQSVTAGNNVPSDNLHWYTQMWIRNRKEKDGLHAAQVAVDYDYFATLQARFIAGRNFARDHATDANGAVIINAEAARELNLENPVGAELSGINNASDPQKVIGVVEDIHFRSFREKVVPAVFFLRPSSAATFLLRLDGNDIPSTMKFLESRWESVVPGEPFIYTFLDESYDSLYRSDRQTSRVIVVFCVFAVAISSVGLLGVISLLAQTKRKEIGVRKVLGASLADVMLVITREYLVVVAVAVIIAWPLACYVTSRWLEGFVYRIDPTWWPFAEAGGLALFVALVTVSIQTLRAGLANPIESLRTE